MDPTDGVAGWVCVPTSALRTIEIRHRASIVDLSIAAPSPMGQSPPGGAVTGSTQWAGAWRNDEIFVDWDWGVLRGVVIVLDPCGIRTNIRLIMDNGEAVAPLLARIHLFDWVESLPWRDPHIEELIERHAR